MYSHSHEYTSQDSIELITMNYDSFTVEKCAFFYLLYRLHCVDFPICINSQVNLLTFFMCAYTNKSVTFIIIGEGDTILVYHCRWKEERQRKRTGRTGKKIKHKMFFAQRIRNSLEC